MKKVISIVLMMVLILSLSVSLVACKNTSEEQVYDVELEEDSYDMLGATDVFSSLIDTALNSIGGGIKTGVTQVTSNVADWAVKGLLNALGFSYGTQPSFQDQVVENLKNINSEIVNLENKIDWLTSSFADQQYLAVYRDFVKDYKTIAPKIEPLYKTLTEINKNVKDEAKLEKAIDDLCYNIHGGKPVAESALDESLRTLSTYFVGEKTSTGKLEQYNIFNIVERFVTTQTPYKGYL